MVIVSLLCLACSPAPEPAPDSAPPSTTSSSPATETTATEASEFEIVPEPGPAPTTTATTTATATTAPTREITIATVEANNPVTIAGLARTFENNVVLRVRDARGALITETFTTSSGEIGHHNPYRGTVWVTRDPGGAITAEALEYSAKDGSERSLVSEKRPYPVAAIDATLYFPNNDCTAVNAYTRRIPKSVSHARLLIETLLAGPLASERGAVNAFPQGSAVNSVNLRGGTLTVDFNERLQNVGGACRAQMIRESVTRTLRGLPSVQKVVITAAGSEALALQP